MGNSRYKGPVASVDLVCWKDSEEARVAGAEQCGNKVRRKRMRGKAEYEGPHGLL